MRAIEIKPLDTLFFRDGKPFSIEDDTMATGLFPPPPSVLYGVLRTAYATGQSVSYEDIVGATSHLKIRDLRYSFRGAQYYPAPLDLVIDADLELSKCRRPLADLLPRFSIAELKTPMYSNHPFEQILLANTHVQGVDGLYMGLGEWIKYLAGEEPSFLLFNPRVEGDRHFFAERKVGIGRDRKRNVAAEGRLYRVEMQRAIDFGMIVNTNVKGEEVLSVNNRCGAEGKVVQLQDQEFQALKTMRNTQVKEFKIILTSPSFFSKGYLPDLAALPAFKEFTIEILAACIGRKKAIGGFDMKLRRPKPLRFVVPEGSVYYCRIKGEGTLTDLLTHAELPSSISTVRAKEGFGLYQLGKVRQSKEDDQE